MSTDAVVVIGEAVKPHGIRGEIKVRSFMETFEAFGRSSVLIFGDTPYRLLGVRSHKGAALVRLEGIDTPEKARELVGSLVKTAAENLPPTEEDEYYWFELIGMTVLTREGRMLGTVTRIIETGANDVIQVEGPLGEVLLPMIDDVVLDVDTEKKEMIVDPLDGLVPDG